jgi:hypothetical protein
MESIVVARSFEPGPSLHKRLQALAYELGTIDLRRPELLQGALGEKEGHSCSVVEMTVGQEDVIYSRQLRRSVTDIERGSRWVDSEPGSDAPSRGTTDRQLLEANRLAHSLSAQATRQVDQIS